MSTFFLSAFFLAGLALVGHLHSNLRNLPYSVMEAGRELIAAVLIVVLGLYVCVGMDQPINLRRLQVDGIAAAKQ